MFRKSEEVLNLCWGDEQWAGRGGPGGFWRRLLRGGVVLPRWPGIMDRSASAGMECLS